MSSELERLRAELDASKKAVELIGLHCEGMRMARDGAHAAVKAAFAERDRLINELASARRVLLLGDAAHAMEHPVMCAIARDPNDACDCGLNDFTAALEVHLEAFPVVGV